MNARVLIASDDLEAGQIWAHALGRRGLKTALSKSAQEVMHLWRAKAFELIVIDVYAPEFDGIDVCRRLRAEAVVPILLLTPWSDEAHVLEAYKAGADECVVKPISPSLFLAKVTAWFRHSWTVTGEALGSLKVGDLELDPSRREILRTDGAAAKLTNLEFRVLHLLMMHPGQVLEPDVIVDRVWGYTGAADSTLLKNVIYRLRRKVEPDPSHPRYICTVAGIGYTLQTS